MTNWADLTLGATRNFDDIDSPEQMKPPYPAFGTPNWWAMRKRLQELYTAQQKRRKIDWTPAQVERSRNAQLTALGDSEAQKRYERNGFTREQWLKRWNPEGKYGDGFEFKPPETKDIPRED